MLNHHIQKKIISTLMYEDEMRFTDLKPEDLDNKAFNYHLKITINDGLVHKNEDGNYYLTAEGRRIGSSINQKDIDNLNGADSTLFLVIRRKSDGAWLLYRRLTHPLIDRVGFMHGHPDSSESSTETAKRICSEKLGINVHFNVLGAGFFRVFDDGELESFTNFTLLVAEDAEGEINSDDETAEYYWVENPDFNSAEMLPNMPALVEHYQKGEVFFLEQRLDS